jgi:hypothetical protein
VTSAGADTEYLAPTPVLASLRFEAIDQYVTAYQNFLGVPLNGSIAWSLRALGNISRPFYPDDIDGNVNGPLSKPAGEWSIFSTGLQLDLVYNAIIKHVAFVAGVGGVADFTPAELNCTGYKGFSAVPKFDLSAGQFPELRNGLTLFAGGLPIYRGGILVGAIGASGDGLEQDNMVPLLAVDAVSKLPGSTLNNAPKSIRADTLSPDGVNLRWAICPQKPFLDSNEEDPCEGK